MVHILVGEQAVRDFQSENWENLEVTILEDYGGDIIGWDKETDNVSTLLDMLRGWDDFVELSKEDLKDIKTNTEIKIDYGDTI